MTKFKLALSAEPDLFACNRILDREWAIKYPGASWMPILKEKLAQDYEVVTADIALSHVKQGYWKASDIFVVQHGSDHTTEKLVEEGARPLLITCFESPLYLGEFYDSAEKFASKFSFKIFFSGLHSDWTDLNQIQVTFPSYFTKDLDSLLPSWGDRRLLVAVVGNKYVLPEMSLRLTDPKYLAWWIRKKVASFVYGSFHSKKFAVKTVQLQDLRLEIISFFMSRDKIDLYGQGWGSLRNLPPRWQKKLQPFLRKKPAKICDVKLSTIRNYRFGLCIENAKFPGYVTEKIIDCFVAGVIPVYMGAPDIESYIPPNCYIDLREFDSLPNLLDYLESMPEDVALKYLGHGRAFLKSDIGQSYSYEGFASLVERIVRIGTISK